MTEENETGDDLSADFEGGSVGEKAVKLIGEFALVPGTSLLLDGKIKSGLGHVLAGGVARLALGVPGLLLVAANSYSSSSTGKSLLGNLKS